MRLPQSDLEAAGFVLAGGLSSRMGQDKALTPFAGEPLIVHALEVLWGAGLSVAIAGARSALESFAPVIEDSDPRGPLSGICAAMGASSARRAVFLPVDLPLLPSSLIGYLLWHAGITEAAATLVSVNGFPQTFPVVIDRAAAPLLDEELQAGHLRCLSAFQTAAMSLGKPLSILPVESLVQSGKIADPAGLPAVCWFMNVNAPDELRRAETFYRASSRKLVAR